ncbi:unnamed protein product [Amoebophrya sp. A120]|nr:unnamed protein product [Amoebophrya sp. A120]|eukprot:GSA120T00022323001.1
MFFFALFLFACVAVFGAAISATQGGVLLAGWVVWSVVSSCFGGVFIHSLASVFCPSGAVSSLYRWGPRFFPWAAAIGQMNSGGALGSDLQARALVLWAPPPSPGALPRLQCIAKQNGKPAKGFDHDPAPLKQNGRKGPEVGHSPKGKGREFGHSLGGERREFDHSPEGQAREFAHSPTRIPKPIRPIET